MIYSLFIHYTENYMKIRKIGLVIFTKELFMLNIKCILFSDIGDEKNEIFRLLGDARKASA